MKPALSGVHSEIDKAISERAASISKLNALLEADITELGKEVVDIKNLAQVRRCGLDFPCS